MAKKKFSIWLDELTAIRLRKRAIAEGRTLSETGAGLMESALESNGSDEMLALEKVIDRKFIELKEVLLKELEVRNV